MPNSRTKYTVEFKIDAVRQVLAGNSVAETASALQIPTKTLATWVKLNQQNSSTQTCNPVRNADKREIIQLRRELARVKLELSHLIQATAQFVRCSI